MEKKFWLIWTTMLVAGLFACNKDKFTTEPQVKIQSISPDVVEHGDIVRMKGRFTDDEGDLDSALIVSKWYQGDSATKIDTFRYSFEGLKLPPKTRDGDLEIIFEYNTQNVYPGATLPGAPRDTTSTLGVILIDKAAHRSNYSESDRIRLKKV